MDKSYRVLVNKNLKLEIAADAVQGLDASPSAENSFHILHNNRSFRAELLRTDFYGRTYAIRIGGETFEVAIQSDLNALIQKMGYTLGSSRTMNSIKAPMPGIIIDIQVEPGQQVHEGEALVVLEAMKMENAIVSPSDATIKEILVKKGDTVEKNKLLIELE